MSQVSKPVLMPMQVCSVNQLWLPGQLIKLHMQECGVVNRVTILTDRIGNAKGYAYIEFEKADAAVSAVLLDNTELRGRQIKVCLVYVTRALPSLTTMHASS